MGTWITWCIVGLLSGAELLFSVRCAVLAQNNGYVLPKSTTLVRAYVKISIPSVCVSIAVVLSALFYDKLIWVALIAAFSAFLFQIFDFLQNTSYYKFTNRGKKYFIIEAFFNFLLIVLFVILHKNGMILLSGLCLIIVLYPLLFAFIALPINHIYEKNNKRFIQTKSTEFIRKSIKTIAITGSYGKTSCKMILSFLLSERMNVLATPGNYNTPIGVAMCTEKVKPCHDVFIAEFGARKKGDIEELCALFPPDVGILTGICAQHLETFGSLDAICREKSVLCKMVEKNGVCVFNLNDKNVYRIWKEHRGKKIACSTRRNADLKAINIQIINFHTYFEVVIGDRCYPCSTKLLGEHNVVNILNAFAVGLEMGLSIEYMIERIQDMEPIEHRLAYQCKNGIHIIDDGYNGNSEGVKVAADVLRAMEGRKIVVTQGIVELGGMQREINISVGETFGKVADVIVTCGPNAKAIEKGVRNISFEGMCIRIRSRKAIPDTIRRIIKQGDVVLFQNDVPDIY